MHVACINSMRGPSPLYGAPRFPHDVGWDIRVARRSSPFAVGLASHALGDVTKVQPSSFLLRTISESLRSPREVSSRTATFSISNSSSPRPLGSRIHVLNYGEWRRSANMSSCNRDIAQYHDMTYRQDMDHSLGTELPR